ncbi:alkane 1-monooxygenase [Shewanella sp. HL-SH2]|uniref:alkane 1-monooxygenase n=1 Tax=Shewanella sp. HL-SH2 TaxID=3436238 RepID=UPI003EB82E87
MHYLKFMSFHLMGLFTLAALTLGQFYIVLGYAIWLLFYIGGDIVLGDDDSTPSYAHHSIMTWQLWLALPLLMAILFVFSWHFATTDIWGYGQWITELTGYDALAAKANTSWYQQLVLVAFTGLVIGVIGTVTGHELVHRTWHKMSYTIGRWLLAFSFDANFAIEHVYGHHRFVCTAQDPASAPRGRNVYQHIIVSSWYGNISAWNIEKRRLSVKSLPIFSRHNRALRGIAMSLVILLAVFALGSWQALAFFIPTALWAKATLEIVNYMEHYGLVRANGTKVAPRHSWNTNKRISSWSLFNLTRHSHHHAQAQVPYHRLAPYEGAPMMISGYLATLGLTLIPPLWHRLMLPRLAHWDTHFANEDEKVLAQQANDASGIAAYQQMHQVETGSIPA